MIGIRDGIWQIRDFCAATNRSRQTIIATSGGHGMRFEPSGRHHQLFDPRTGQSANTYRSVTEVARRATVADALSTALYVMERPAARRLARRTAADQVLLIDRDGRLDRLIG